MSITDELREWAEDNTLKDRVLTTYPPQHAVHGVLETLLRIADRIDAEHEEAIQQALMGKGSVPATDENMAELGWMRLPLDANGEPIHVGDTLDGYGKTIEVVEMRHGRGGWVLISRDGNGYADTFAFAHHHEPTVEDVLRDVVTLCHNTWKEGSAFEFYDVDDVMKSSNIAEYAAKLRMAESEDA